MYIVAIIPARGGSKGLPLKNIRPLLGIPLVATSINAAKQSTFINDIFVSTDSEEIANVSKQYGALVINRPNDLSVDTASSESALIHAIDVISKTKKPDIVVFLQCTAPFLTATDIDGCINTLINQKADSCFAATEFCHFLWKNPENAVGINHDGAYRKRRQDLEPQYLESGSVYVMNTEKFLREKTRFCGKTVIYDTKEEERALEIDDASEFYMAEHKALWLQKTKEEKENYRLKTVKYHETIKNIKAIIFDFDGIFTDNCVYVDENGKETVKCSRGDGLTISLLKKLNKYKLLVVSTEKNSCVSARCIKLGIDVKQNCGNKLEYISSWCKENNINLKEVMYCGNDLNDACMLGNVGIFACPNDAATEIKQQADWISSNNGSQGFLRDIYCLFV